MQVEQYRSRHIALSAFGQGTGDDLLAQLAAEHI